jgi:hypothetical protein
MLTNATTTSLAVTGASTIGATSTFASALSVGSQTTPDATLTVFGNAHRQDNQATWDVFSDSRLKKDVVDYSDGLDLILNTTPKVFSYNGLAGTSDDGKKHVGIIAQDVAQKAPYMFTKTFRKLNPSDSDTTELYMYNGGTDFIYALINAVKELNAKITSLKNDRVETKTLCVEDVCVTKEQFLRMVQQANGNSTPTQTANTGSATSQVTQQATSTTDTQATTTSTASSDVTGAATSTTTDSTSAVPVSSSPSTDATTTTTP